MMGFLAGAFLGGAVGVAAICLCSVASEADKQLSDEKKLKDSIEKY